MTEPVKADVSHYIYDSETERLQGPGIDLGADVLGLDDTCENFESCYEAGASSQAAEVAALKAEVERYREALEVAALNLQEYGPQFMRSTTTDTIVMNLLAKAEYALSSVHPEKGEK